LEQQKPSLSFGLLPLSSLGHCLTVKIRRPSPPFTPSNITLTRSRARASVSLLPRASFAAFSSPRAISSALRSLVCFVDVFSLLPSAAV
jgi:hypothetical protein